MKYLYFGLSLLILTAGCSPAKKINRLIGEGHYDQAIQMAVHKLRRKRNVKSADKYVLLLERAFAKAQAEDVDYIEKLRKDPRVDKWELIYNRLVKINNRQNVVRPLLPLRVVSQNREAHFDMRDFSDATVQAKENYALYLYDQALNEMRKNTKEAYRKAYELFEKVEFLRPGFRDTAQLMEQAHAKGVASVGINIINRTDKVIPAKLLAELTRFDISEAENFWTRYSTLTGDSTDYDYVGKLIFTDIQVSPEREREKVIVRERQIQDGWRYQKDAYGNPVKDSLGRPVKVPVYRNVQATAHLYEQLKEAKIQAVVLFIDPHTGQSLFSKPLNAGYVFQHRFATYTGDSRALEEEILKFTQKQRVPFPSNEQMIYDAGMDIKNQFYDILRNTKFN